MITSAALALLLNAPFPGGFGAPKVTITAEKDVVHVTVEVGHDGETPAPKAPVPFTFEPWVFAVNRKVAKEANLFGSGLAFDLNGDGKTTASIPLKCDGPVAVFGKGQRIEPFGAEMQYPGSIVRMRPRGAYAVLYTPCDEDAIIGLSPKPMKVHTHPGPFLMINVVEKVGGPKAPSRLKVEAITLDRTPVKKPGRFRARSYEPIDGSEPSWGVVHSVLVTLPDPRRSHVVTLNVSGPGQGLVAASVNLSPRKGTRIRSRFGNAKFGANP